MARTYTYLFGFGATLLVISLALPHSADRNLGVLIGVAVGAYAVAGGYLFGFDRFPLWVYRATPFVGTIMIGLIAYFGGSGRGHRVRVLLLLGRPGRLVLLRADDRRGPRGARLRASTGS